MAESIAEMGLTENKKAAKIGGGIAKKARKDFETKTGTKVVTKENYLIESNKKLKQ